MMMKLFPLIPDKIIEIKPAKGYNNEDSPQYNAYVVAYTSQLFYNAVKHI